eukprot:5415786-Pleurochrysis_carterae.AAC.2
MHYLHIHTYTASTQCLSHCAHAVLAFANEVTAHDHVQAVRTRGGPPCALRVQLTRLSFRACSVSAASLTRSAAPLARQATTLQLPSLGSATYPPCSYLPWDQRAFGRGDAARTARAEPSLAGIGGGGGALGTLQPRAGHARLQSMVTAQSVGASRTTPGERLQWS